MNEKMRKEEQMRRQSDVEERTRRPDYALTDIAFDEGIRHPVHTKRRH
jgi:hypothetical protein